VLRVKNKVRTRKIACSLSLLLCLSTTNIDIFSLENKKSLNAEESENNKIKSCLKEDVEPSVHPEHDFLRTNYHPKFTKSLKDSR